MNCRDRVYGHPIEGIVVTEDGHCADEMNRNMWSMIFNVLLGVSILSEPCLTAAWSFVGALQHHVLEPASCLPAWSPLFFGADGICLCHVQDKGVPATPQDVLAADAAAAGSVTDEAAAAGSSRTDARPQDVRRRRRRQLML